MAEFDLIQKFVSTNLFLCAVSAYWGSEDEGGYMFAYCLDHKIKMTSGLYGRRGLIWGWACSIDVLKTLQKECDGKFDCRVQVVNKMFGDDPCSGESKILQYAWYCE